MNNGCTCGGGLDPLGPELRKLYRLYCKHLDEIRQLNLQQWLILAKALDVPQNDREAAAKKLALADMQREARAT